MAVDVVLEHYERIAFAIQGTVRHWRVTGPDAEDLAMHLWCVLLRNDARSLRQFAGRSSLSTYLFRVLHRAAGRWVRARRRVEVLHGDTYTAYADIAGAFDGNTHAAAEARITERVRALRTALTSLSEPERTVIEARLEGRRIADIARLTGLSADAVDHRLRRALGHLRALLSGLPHPVQASQPASQPASKQARRRLAAVAAQCWEKRESSIPRWPARTFGLVSPRDAWALRALRAG